MITYKRVEGDRILFAEVAAVIDFERPLRGRQHRALGVVNELSLSPTARPAIAQAVEHLQAAHARIEHAFAALAVHIVLEVTGHRCHDFNVVSSEELRETLLSRLLEYRQVAAVHHLDIEFARGAHEIAEMRIELRRAARHVERGDVGRARECEHVIDGFARHRLGAGGSRIDVTMQARLVALVAEIDLQRFQPLAPDRGKVRYPACAGVWRALPFLHRITYTLRHRCVRPCSALHHRRATLQSGGPLCGNCAALSLTQKPACPRPARNFYDESLLFAQPCAHPCIPLPHVAAAATACFRVARAGFSLQLALTATL